MAPTTGTSSPRDDHVDAHPDLARKKQRLRESHNASAPEDSVLVEALEPEDIGGSLGTAIEIEDDDSIMALYSEDFSVRPRHQPLRQVSELLREITAKNCYMSAKDFVLLTDWIHDHCAKTRNDGSVAWQQQYMGQDWEFFAELSHLALAMLRITDLFEPADIHKVAVRDAFERFFIALGELNCRIIPMLPDRIKTMLSRRDSALPNAALGQTTEIAQYLEAAVLLNPQFSMMAANYKRQVNCGTEVIAATNLQAFAQPDVLAALVSIMELLSEAMRQIKDSWVMMRGVLKILLTLILSSTVSIPNNVLERSMQVVNESVLPAVCAKHPGALPHNVHNELLSFGLCALQRYAASNDHESVCQAYLRFVRRQEDAVLPEEAPDMTVSEMLSKASGNDGNVLSHLLATSWEMQASMSFIRSDIMNIRSLGLSALSKRLLEAYEASKNVQDLEHIYVQHSVRFLRKNEVSKYIFSSDSHASLISQSMNVITFLSATSTYTDQESDVIWRACTTSVEADFVKASFAILTNQLPHLDFGHLLHILDKYATTPVAKLGLDATEFLPALLQRFEQVHSLASSRTDRLALALSTIDVLRHVDESGPTPFSGTIQKTLHIEVARVAGETYTADDRRDIFARCLPDIGKHTSAGTTAVRVFTILLANPLSPEDIQTVSAMYPVGAAADDLRDFVAAHRGRSQDTWIINCVDLRLAFIIRLMSLEKGPPSDDAAQAVFDCVFAESALSDSARSAAWGKLHSLNGAKNAPSAALHLWRMYMQRYVPLLSADLASPRLMELIWAYLRDECVAEKIGSNFIPLLDHPLWEALRRFAISDNDGLVDAATSVITHLLFDYPASEGSGVLRETAVDCQRRSVRAHIRRLGEDYESLLKGTGSIQERVVTRAIGLLHAILFRCRDFATSSAQTHGHDVLQLDDSADESDRILFTVQVYGAEPQSRLFSAEASKDTTVSQFLAALPSKTGASNNRIIAGGREITRLAAQSLWEAGLQNSGVLQVCPRYSQDFDFDHLLRSLSPVELEIVAHSDSLEVLVDGPASIAERAIHFLSILPPTAQARYKVTSSSAADDLFPHDRPSRSLFSIHILEWHLRDCAKIGVADIDFLTRSIQLLTSVVMDTSRNWLDAITGRVISCLRAFLQGKIEEIKEVEGQGVTILAERPLSDSKTPYFGNGACFSARMIAKMSEMMTHDDLANTRPFAVDAYSVLLLASQADDSVWQHFSIDDQSTALHAQLFLSPDRELSEQIANPIKSLCQDTDTPSKVPDFFWRVIFTCLPKALQTPSRSIVLFDLASEILHATELIRGDETSARRLVEQLSLTLWDYRHTESANVSLRDDAVVGLLRLLRESVTILKSFKRPLQLDGFPSKIATLLLFPDMKDPASRPLVHCDSRVLAYDLLRLTLEAPVDFDNVVQATEQAVHLTGRSADIRFPGFDTWLRAPGECSGLVNLGMTCYMNSMLQQLFGNIQFRKFVLDLSVVYPEKQQLLQQIQKLFAKMQNSVEQWQNTAELAQILGVEVGNQEDVHDFYANLLSRLEDEMPDRQAKVTLSHFFTGQSVTQIRGECGHVSSTKEVFSDLSVTVKNKATLHESLAEFVQGEPMQGANKYKCMGCDPENGLLVDAMRRTCLEIVPDCLTVCLKRFTYENKIFGEGKVNDRFDFPESIDMSLFKHDHLERPGQSCDPDMFQLVGVIVHQGNLNFGHYWSYVRVPSISKPQSGDWYCLEDTKTSYCPGGFQVVRQECIGGIVSTNGNERTDNAYVLCYQRKQYLADGPAACQVSEQHQGNPSMAKALLKVPLNDQLASEVNSCNSWRQGIAALFDDQFASHVRWLLYHFETFKDLQTVASDAGSASDAHVHGQDLSTSYAEAKLGALVADYLLRILLSDPSREIKLAQTLEAVGAAQAASPEISRQFLDVFSVDEFGFEAILCNDHANVRIAMFKVLTTCIENVRDQDEAAYKQALHQLLAAHSPLLSNGYVDQNPRTWDDYFAFPAWVAKQGFTETGIVLDHEYFNWIIEVIYMTHNPDWRRKHEPIWGACVKRDPAVDYNPMCDFLYELCNEHVDLSDFDTPAEDAGPRTRTARGWRLKELESQGLTMPTDINKHHIWNFFHLANLRCPVRQKLPWQDYGLGKLLGLLVSEKADPAVKDLITDTLLYRYDKEEQVLMPLLYATWHYCAHVEDRDCGKLLLSLGNTLPMWTNSEANSLAFLSSAFEMTPRSILDSAIGAYREPGWAHQFLCNKRQAVRQLTEAWLKDRLFVDDPLSDNPSLDAGRARLTRSLAKSLMSGVQTAYNQEQPKNKWESAMEILQTAKTYISSLSTAVKAAQEGGAALSSELLVENDESKALLLQLRELLEGLKDWESEYSLPTRGASIRQSVEMDDTDELVSDDELEDVDDLCSHPM